MTVLRLSAEHFRNLAPTDLSPDGRANLFYGRNAQGKTNLLEAIWLFTGARSFRHAKDAELLRFGEKQAKLTLSFRAGGREQEAELYLADGRRKARLNGVDLPGAAGLSGEFCAVIFSPEHLSLVKAGPAVRRAFLDEAICPLRPRHAVVLAAYRKALFQRNSLLKDLPRHMDLLDTLDIWDERLAKLGAAVLFARVRYLARLIPKAETLHAAISNGSEKADFAYETAEELNACVRAKDPHSVEMADALFRVLRAHRAADIEAGATGVGPHRDDLSILIAGVPARSFASQGQQRTAALALKLAEAEVLKEVTGEAPVLLLDDVFSEMDGTRQDYLLHHIEGAQVFITTCEPQRFSSAAGAVFSLNEGTVRTRENAG